MYYFFISMEQGKKFAISKLLSTVPRMRFIHAIRSLDQLPNDEGNNIAEIPVFDVQRRNPQSCSHGGGECNSD